MVGGSAALYQAVIVLIPAILFGGAMLEVRRVQPSELSQKVLIGVVLLFFLILGVCAEVLAIGGAIEPDSVSSFEQHFLGCVVIAGTTGLAVWTALPLFVAGTSQQQQQQEEEEKKTTTEEKKKTTEEKKQERLTKWPVLLAGAAIVALATIVGGMVVIGGHTDRADAQARFELASQRRVDSQRDLFAAEEEMLAASARLIQLAQSIPHPGLAKLAVVTELARLREGTLGLMRRALAENEIRSQVGRAHENLRTIARRLRFDFEWRIKGITAVDEKLMAIAAMRVMIGSYGAIGAAAEHARALQQLKTVCGEKELGWDCA